ncbi:PAS domain-containing protein [Mangrovibacterium diazotrophicum]|uniref:PAS domain S-box-containing protein n=1 Tax=Mangrovibacterium diazotrophicum TaxID=1261403 RepID=A0A419VXU7_9BACT|nr:PAS domain-containing protein [Mangrovibacterium diazotrophicum]RKD87900.1 PAS domain S-box-containing protein [Mangrovibacterium diazotrophicum]
MIYDDKSFQSGWSDFSGIQQQIIDTLPTPVFFRKPEGELLFVNRAFCELVDCGQVVFSGKTLSDFLDPNRLEPFERLDGELLAGKGKQHYEARIRNIAGATCEYAFEKSLIHDESGALIGIFCLMRDLCELRKIERRVEEALEASEMASAMLHKIRAGIVIVDSDWHVINSNPGFAQLIGGDVAELYESVPGLKGANLKELVPDTIYRMFVSIMSSGEASLDRDLRYQNKLLHVSVITIYKNRVVGALIRDMSAPALVREEIVSRAHRVNKQNMETVQKIAFLLGENASVMEELLHSIIESYSYGEEDEA